MYQINKLVVCTELKWITSINSIINDLWASNYPNDCPVLKLLQHTIAWYVLDMLVCLWYVNKSCPSLDFASLFGCINVNKLRVFPAIS